jgi:hypothetical protein
MSLRNTNKKSVGHSRQDIDVLNYRGISFSAMDNIPTVKNKGSVGNFV